MDGIDNYMAIYKKQNEKALYKLWECAICGEKFSNAEYLETHLRACHEDAFASPPIVADNDWKPIMCFHDNANDTNTHRWICDNCHKIMISKVGAQLHADTENHTLLSDNPDDVNPVIKPKEQSARWSCSMCHMLFFDEHSAQEHMISRGHNIKEIPRMPPLGLMPKDIWESKRIEAILDAIKRFRNEEQNIPGEWLDELTELWGRQKVKQQ